MSSCVLIFFEIGKTVFLFKRREDEAIMKDSREHKNIEYDSHILCIYIYIHSVHIRGIFKHDKMRPKDCIDGYNCKRKSRSLKGDRNVGRQRQELVK